jgi:hypothetical protein
MFVLRGIAVSFSIFVLLHAVLSVAVGWGWRELSRGLGRHIARPGADLIFSLRLLPFAVASAVTLVFAVPSFLLLEPRAVNEPLSAVAVLLGLSGMAVLLMGLWNAAVALASASRTVACWSSLACLVHPSPIASTDSVPVFRVAGAGPPLTAVGILRPSVWVSAAAELLLTGPEFQTALRHELAHVRRRDNLRKFILRLVAFPGMTELESAWREASEMAADDAAVSNASEALDLAAAVIKLSRVASLDAPADLTSALVHSPAESVNARVERLIAWTEQRRRPPAPQYSFQCALGAGAAIVVALVLSYSGLLIRMHAATEWLVR